jgi:antitoxin component YwqK of YwqJK toxin-antitoxin module
MLSERRESAITVVMRWPRRTGQPRPAIPARAEEKILGYDKRGAKERSEFWLNGKRVGFVSWDPWEPSGTPGIAGGYRNGVRVGYHIVYDRGTVSYAEPFKNGLVHGWAKQFNARGRLIFEGPFKNGTGTDYWCDEKGRLAEEHPLVEGKPSGWERWWSEDQKSIYSETHWANGEWHGIKREWARGRLDRGYPKFYVRGKQISKREYPAAARRDTTLPPYRPEDDSPARRLPARFIQLKRRFREKVKRRT